MLLALVACPQNNKPGTTDDPEDAGTTSEASTSTTSAASSSSSSDPPSTSTGETSEPETTSTSTTTVDPETTTTGDACAFDLTVTLALDFDQCDGSLVLIATVHNVGTDVEVPAGIDVTVYEGIDGSGIKLVSEPTSEPVPPGGSTDISWVFNAPPANESRDYHVEVGVFIGECDEDNNSAVLTDVACP